MKHIQIYLLGLLLFTICIPVQAIITGELIMVRSNKPFADTMKILQNSIKKEGYTLSYIQQVDTGLTNSGYPTDKYRIVFFGNPEQMKALTKFHPDLIPYLPLKISIFAESNETLLVTADPAVFIDLYPDPRLRKVFKKWHEDLVNIMKNVQNPD